MFYFSHQHPISKRYCYRVSDEDIISSLLQWAQNFPLISYYNSNAYYDNLESSFHYHKYEYILGFSFSKEKTLQVADYEQLNNYLRDNTDWLLGYLSYDLKNEFYNLNSKNIDNVNFDNLFFFSPDMVLYKTIKGNILLESKEKIEAELLYKTIKETDIRSTKSKIKAKINSRFSRQEYLETVNKIKDEIQNGNVYELNFCQEFYGQQIDINPLETYKSLVSLSPTPFSAFLKQENHFLISASPERYLTKRGTKAVSQPIKGTIRKDSKPEIDKKLIAQLKNNPKERAENIMIVDLVRNDLSQTAQKDSVCVEELCGIYPFNQLHQMISTVSSVLRDDKNALDLIQSSFPMGSMTGAPKLRAMELIEKYEKTKRGIYSGSVGYFEPNGDFDFNVVIRSILYNQDNKYLSFSVGSAITIQSDAEQEYDECLLKAEAIRAILL